MDLFVANEAVLELEERLPAAPAGSRPDLLVQLAWYLRQSDPQRSKQYLGAFTSQMPFWSLTEDYRRKLEARARLISAEFAWLSMDLTEAERGARQACAEFYDTEDFTGCADAHWLLGWIAIDQGRVETRDAEFHLMADAASRAGDQVRLDVANALQGRWLAFSDMKKAELRHAEMAHLASDANAVRAAWVNEFLAIELHFKQDQTKSLGFFIQTYNLSVMTGQTYFAIIAANNIADEFSILNESLLALEWIQRALNLARQIGWPRCIGHCLMQMSEVLRRIRSINAAGELLNEALQTLQPIQDSRSYSLALCYQGNLALDTKDYNLALKAFQEFERRAKTLHHRDFYIQCQRGMAHALSYLGRPTEAVQVAKGVLRLAEDTGERAQQVDTMMLLADIYLRHPALNEEQPGPIQPAQQMLAQAMELASATPGYVIPARLYEMLSQDYAAAGKFEQAFQSASKAIEAREHAQHHESITRATNIQVLHEIERIRHEGEYHRQLALTETRRAKDLMQLNGTLEQLSAIGREITTHLDQDDIFKVLDKYVHTLMDVEVFKIYLADEDKQQMVMPYCVEHGVKLAPVQIDLHNEFANSVRCYREGVELLCQFEEVDDINLQPGTLDTATGLFFPLSIADRRIGVMSVESMRRNAFQQRELLIFRSLCAFAAIGFENARTYGQLQNAQQSLVQKEKMAALGSIVAGVAHELNTPIGNGILLASSMHEKTLAITQNLHNNAIRRSELAAYLEESERASYLIINSFQVAADLVTSFKQVSVDQTTAQQRRFSLKQLMDDIAATMRNQFSTAGIAISLDIPEPIELDSFPGPLGQVVMNLMQNALLHAFEGRHDGQLVLRCERHDERVRISCTDNGSGIAAANLSKIFDPFFTTKLGSGGNGLGLSISYNIVKSILRGDISVHSQLGQGTSFVLDLPVKVLQPDDRTVAASAYSE